MKVLNHVVELSLRANTPWTKMRIHKGRENWYGPVYYRHLVWGKVSLIFGQPHLMPVTVCAHCNDEIRVISAGDESWNYCESCGCTEGDTKTITTEEFEELHA